MLEPAQLGGAPVMVDGALTGRLVLPLPATASTASMGPRSVTWSISDRRPSRRGQVGLDVGLAEVATDDLGAALAEQRRGRGPDARCPMPSRSRHTSARQPL